MHELVKFYPFSTVALRLNLWCHKTQSFWHTEIHTIHFLVYRICVCFRFRNTLSLKNMFNILSFQFKCYSVALSCFRQAPSMGSGASADVGPTGIKDVHLNHAVTKKYMALSQHGKVQAEFLRRKQGIAGPQWCLSGQDLNLARAHHTQKLCGTFHTKSTGGRISGWISTAAALWPLCSPRWGMFFHWVLTPGSHSSILPQTNF